MGESSSNPKLMKSYLDAMNGSPLKPDALEFGLDCSDQKILLEYQNFEPQKTLELLIKRASTTVPPTPPDRFLQEMNELVILGAIRVRNKGRISNATQEARYATLARKYEIGDDPKHSEPDVITHQRLTFTFPQYFAVKDVGVVLSGFDIWEYSVSSKVYCTCLRLFSLPQFGGLIPSRNFEALSLDLRKAIVTVHIFCLLKYSQPKLPLRTHLMLLKKRIRSGVPSDDRRLRFLQNNDVVTLRGKLTETTQKEFDLVSQRDEVRDKIEWSLLFD